MKNKINFILIVVIFTAWFIDVWVLICAVALFLTCKYFSYKDKQRPNRTKADPVKSPTRTKESTTDSTVHTTNSTDSSAIMTNSKDPEPDMDVDALFAPENQEYLPQEPTDRPRGPE